MWNVLGGSNHNKNSGSNHGSDTRPRSVEHHVGEDGVEVVTASNDRNNDDDDDASSSSYNSQELGDMLSNMDIDNDFTVWTSFRSSVRSISTGGNNRSGSLASIGSADAAGAGGGNADVEQLEDLKKWRKRYMRNEVYSKLYKPSQKEAQELNDLERFLGMASKRPGTFGRLISDTFTSVAGGGGQSSIAEEQQAAPGSTHSLGSQQGGGSNYRNFLGRRAWDMLIHPLQQEPQYPESIILKRGPVLCQSAPRQQSKECELILLTHGIVIATVVDGSMRNKRGSSGSNRSIASSNSNASSDSKVVKRKLDTAATWEAVRFVEGVVNDGGGGGANSTRFAVWLQTGDVWNFECAAPASRLAWTDAFERALVQTTMHHDAAAAGITSQLGWQYTLVHRPAYTLAVTNDAKAFSVDQVRSDPALNQCDKYSGYAPIHYAVKLHNVEAARRLLQSGANPNLPTSFSDATDEDEEEGMTPMYFAVRDGMSDMVSLLKMHGAAKSIKAEQEQRGELFGRVAATEREMKEKKEKEHERRELEQQVQAKAAQHQMGQNMQALRERGEKIEQLGSKATELNEGAATYADLARQMKEQSKKKNKMFGLF